MHTSRKRREDDQQEQAARPEAPPRAPTAAERMLHLQRSAGNQAVARTLARDTAAPADEKGKTEEGEGKGYVMEIEGLGSVELLSLQVVQSRSPGVHRRPREEGERPRMEIQATIKTDSDMATKIHQALLQGRQFPTVTVKMKGHTLTLTKAMLTSVQVSDNMMSFGIEGEEPEFKRQPTTDEADY
jgi:hypothetical protein